MTRKARKTPGTRKKPGPRARAKVKALRDEADRIAKGGSSAAKTPESVAEVPRELAELGPPPADPLAANAWAHRATLLAMHNAVIDPKITERERRKEIRSLAAAAAKLMPDTRRWEAEQLIRSDREEIDRKEGDRHGAKLEPLPPREGDAQGP